MIERATFATERAREFVNGAGGVFSKARSLVSGDAQFFSLAPKLEDLRRDLDSDSVFEKRDAMKRIVAQMCKGNDMRCLFPDVVKNIHAPSIELRKLIYVFITSYAEDCPNEALLSISAFQKDLIDPSMHVRSLALRMLSSIRIPAIHPVVAIAVKKCADDFAPVVRKTAAISISQMASVSGDDVDRDAMRALVQNLLQDRNADVVGAAVMSFMVVCPDAFELIHPVYRNLCQTVVECEPWGQVLLLRLFLRYARSQFCDPNSTPPPKSRKSGHGSSVDGAGESSDESSSSSSSSSSSPSSSDSRWLTSGAGSGSALNADHQLLLNSVRPLLHSMNTAVVVGVCALYYHCAPRHYCAYCVKPLMRMLGSVNEGQSVILNVVYSIMSLNASFFMPYLTDFFLLPTDPEDVQDLKLRILARLVTPANFNEVLREFRSYVHDYNVRTVTTAVRGLGLIASSQPQLASSLMRLLNPLLSHPDAAVVAEAVVVLRTLAIHGADELRTTQLVFRLMLELMDGKVAAEQAQATILWLVGENVRAHPAVAAAAPDCLRVFVKQFASHGTAVKVGVLTLGCKIWLHLDGSSAVAERFKQIYFHLMELARYDDSYIVRDHARTMEGTVDRQGSAFSALKEAYLLKKPSQLLTDPLAERNRFELGSLSYLYGHAVPFYQELPPWSTSPPNDHLRDPPRAVAESTALSGTSSSATSDTTTTSSSAYSEESSASDWGEDEESGSSDVGDSPSKGGTPSSSADAEASSSESEESSEGGDGDADRSSLHGLSAHAAAAPAQAPVKVQIQRIPPVTAARTDLGEVPHLLEAPASPEPLPAAEDAADGEEQQGSAASLPTALESELTGQPEGEVEADARSSEASVSARAAYDEIDATPDAAASESDKKTDADDASSH